MSSPLRYQERYTIESPPSHEWNVTGDQGLEVHNLIKYFVGID